MDFEYLFTELVQFITSNLYIFLISIIVLIPTIYYIISRKSKHRSVLLVGCSGAGKTRLLCKLCSNSCPITLTSIQPTTLEYTHPRNKNRSIFLIDIPGDGRVRTKYLNEHKSRRIVGLIFLIDSVEFNGCEPEVADVLFELLSLRQFNKTPILFVCNKQDLFPKDTCENIKDRLEKEIHVKRSTQTFSPDALDTKLKPQIIGDVNEEFSFKQIANKISFVPSSIASEKHDNIPGVEHIIDWLLSKI